MASSRCALSSRVVVDVAEATTGRPTVVGTTEFLVPSKPLELAGTTRGVSVRVGGRSDARGSAFAGNSSAAKASAKHATV